MIVKELGGDENPRDDISAPARRFLCTIQTHGVLHRDDPLLGADVLSGDERMFVQIDLPRQD